MEEHQKELCRMLGLGTGLIGQASGKLNSWAEIYEAIGKLKERADRPQYVPQMPLPISSPMPLMNDNPNKHYHGQIVCYNNPCGWC